MSESLQVRWIADYYLKVARTYGANIQNAPREAQSRKVQITRVCLALVSHRISLTQVLQLLTFPRPGYPDAAVWIRISDKQCEIPVKLTSSAVAAYNRYAANINLCSAFPT